MRSIKQRSCYSFWRLRDCGTAEAALQLECGTARAAFRVRYFVGRVFRNLALEYLPAQQVRVLHMTIPGICLHLKAQLPQKTGGNIDFLSFRKSTQIHLLKTF